MPGHKRDDGGQQVGRQRQPGNRNHREYHEGAAVFPGEGMQNSRQDRVRVPAVRADMWEKLLQKVGLPTKQGRKSLRKHMLNRENVENPRISD